MHVSQNSASDLLPQVYNELRALARARLAAHGPVSIQPTQLVHEAYLKLARRDWTWENRAHFFAAAAQAIRRVLLDHARHKAVEKRGGGRERVTLTGIAGPGMPDVDMLSLDAALSRLEELDPEMANVVKLRFLCGLSLPDVARVLEISERTVSRRWESARVWLYRQLQDEDAL